MVVMILFCVHDTTQFYSIFCVHGTRQFYSKTSTAKVQQLLFSVAGCGHHHPSLRRASSAAAKVCSALSWNRVLKA